VLLLPIAVLLPVQMVRPKKEERVLREAFGEEYDRYKAGTWFWSRSHVRGNLPYASDLLEGHYAAHPAINSSRNCK
jgi:hypothetical protein